MDVNSLQQILGISHSSVSQNLSVLRSHRLVQERREGRRVIYKLREPKLATWLVDGLDFVEGEHSVSEQIRGAVESVRSIWSASPPTRLRPRVTRARRFYGLCSSTER